MDGRVVVGMSADAARCAWSHAFPSTDSAYGSRFCYDSDKYRGFGTQGGRVDYVSPDPFDLRRRRASEPSLLRGPSD